MIPTLVLRLVLPLTLLYLALVCLTILCKGLTSHLTTIPNQCLIILALLFVSILVFCSCAQNQLDTTELLIRLCIGASMSACLLKRNRFFVQDTGSYKKISLPKTNTSRSGSVVQG